MNRVANQNFPLSRSGRAHLLGVAASKFALPRLLMVLASPFLFSACGISVFEDALQAQPSVEVPAKSSDTSPSPGANESATVSSIVTVADNMATRTASAENARAASPPPLQWPLDNATSKVELVVLKATGEHRVQFLHVDGALAVVGGQPRGVQVQVTLDKASADSGAFARHLLSPDFLDAKKFALARFSSTQVEVDSTAPGKMKVTGGFTLHGVTRTLSFVADISSETKHHLRRGKAVIQVEPADYQIPTKLMGEELVEGIELHLDLAFLEPKAAKGK